MGNLTGKYDPNAEASNDLGKLPTGEYVVQHVEGDVKANKANTGEFAEFVAEVLDGPYKGRKHWHRVTLTHPNSKAVEIGNRQLAEMRLAMGIEGPADDTSVYLWKPHIIRVEFYAAGSTITFGQKKGSIREYDEAETKAWKKLEGAAAAGTGAPANTPASAPTAQTSSPWGTPKAA